MHCNDLFALFRDGVISSEVAESHDAKAIEITACGAYSAHSAQDDYHEYESIALKDIPPLLSAPTSDSCVQKEDTPSSFVQEGSYSNTVNTPSASSYKHQHYYIPTTAPPSATTTATAALATTTSPQEVEYEKMGYRPGAVTTAKKQEALSSLV